MPVHKLGGKNGQLVCSKCGKPRYPQVPLCPDCWGEANPERGTRNGRGTVIQERLPPDLWQAINFAASMVRKNTPFHTAVVRAARYYDVDPAQVQKGLAQRSGRNQKGKSRKKELADG